MQWFELLFAILCGIIGGGIGEYFCKKIVVEKVSYRVLLRYQIIFSCISIFFILLYIFLFFIFEVNNIFTTPILGLSIVLLVVTLLHVAYCCYVKFFNSKNKNKNIKE